MVSYKVLFDGLDKAVEISQKATSRAPEVGDTVDGSIDMSAPYGPKFKKEFSQGGFSAAPSSSTGSTPRRGESDADKFTMYLSYAKDVAVALIGTKEGFDADKFADILDQVEVGGKVLYSSRPGAEETKAKESEEAPAKDVVPTEEDVDNFLPKDVNDIFEKAHLGLRTNSSCRYRSGAVGETAVPSLRQK